VADSLRECAFRGKDAGFFVAIPPLALQYHSHYYCHLKALSVALCIVSAMLVHGCADPLEKPITQEASEKFQRGITGHGTLVPIEYWNGPDFRLSTPALRHP